MKTVQERLDAPVGQITRLSRVLWWLANLLMVLVPVGVAWTWTHFDQLAPFLPSMAGIPYDPERVTTSILVGAFCLNMIPGAIAIYGFWRLRRLFGLFAVGRYFDVEVIRCVRNFASAALAYGLAAPLTRLLIGLLVSLSNPPGERVLLVRISSDDLVIVFLGGVFFLIARVWSKAKEISDENDQIV